MTRPGPQVPALDTTQRQRLAAGLGLALVVSTVAMVILALRPPEPVGADAEAAQFSAERAMPHVLALAEHPHPSGTPTNALAAKYLLDELGRLGLETHQMTGAAANPRLGAPIPIGRVNTVWARLPGRESTGTVYLVAHYDSVRVGPGASDNGVAVAALLEVARALRSAAPSAAVPSAPASSPTGPSTATPQTATPQTAAPQTAAPLTTTPGSLRNDIVFLFTDGEEDGMLGARQVLETLTVDPGRSIVVNLEARGTHGPLIAFETSDDNTDLLAELARAPQPVGFSLGYEVYRRLPNDTDFTEFRRAGVAGINLAFLDGAPRYHTASDQARYADAGTLQHDGELSLSMARGFGNADLATLQDGQSTFFWVPGMLVRYPNSLVWPLAILAALGVAALVLLARRDAGLKARQFGLASASLLAPVLGVILFAIVVWALMKALRPGYADLILGDTYRPGWSRAGFVALGVATMLAWYGWLRTRLAPASLHVATMAWLAGFGLLLALVAPGGSYLFSLPALAGVAAGIAVLQLRDHPDAPVWTAVAYTLSAGATALVAVPIIALLFPTLGLALAAAPLLLMVLLIGPALPLLELVLPAPTRRTREVRRHWASLPVACAGVAIMMLGAGVVVDGFDADNPRPASLVYTLDADTGTAQWLSADAAPSEWTSTFVRGDPQPIAAQWPNLVSWVVTRYRTGPAEAAALAPPELTTVAQEATGNGRRVLLRLRSARGAPVASLRLATDGPALTSATVDGVALPVDVVPSVPGEWGWGFEFTALPAQGVEVELIFASTDSVRIRVIDEAVGLVGLPGYVTRPPEVGLTPLPTDLTCVGRTVTIPAP